MRPLRLELRGFTAFREAIAVDFSGRELFAITGPTGAGKSSLLDGMTWALYGQVPRVGRATRQLLSHGEQSMSARLDFTARGRRYRVTRRAPATAGTRLEELPAGGEPRLVADRASDVTAQVESVLGLDYPTFTKTVLLPQGAFDSFLRGDDQQRRAILTRLLGLTIYQEARQLARARAQSSTDAATLLAAELTRLTLAAPGARAEIDERHRRARERQEALEARRGALAELSDLAAALERAREAATQRAAAEEVAARRAAEAAGSLALTRREREAADAELERIEAARAALPHDPEERARLGRELERAERRDEARALLDRARASLDEATAAERAADEARCLAQDEARAREGAVADAARRLAAARAALREATAAGRAAAAQLARTAEDRELAGREAERAVEREERLAESRDRLAARLEEALAAHRAAREEAQAAEERARAGAAATTAARAALARAESAHHELHEAREAAHREHAADALRQGLAPGDTCPVCGEAVGTLPAAEAPDVGAADAAETAAALALAEAREEAERAGADELREASRRDGAGQTLAARERALEALDAELAEAGSARETLAADAERARAEARARRAEAAEMTRALGAARGEERALALLVERAGAAADDPADDGGHAPPAADAAAALRTRMDEHDAAADAARAAEDELRDAAARERAATVEARARAELRTQVERGVGEAEERLAALTQRDDSGADLDIGALRSRIKELEAAEGRRTELELAAREAAAAAAAQAAREQERIAAEDRLRRDADRARAEARAGAQGAAGAERAMVELGRTLIDDAAAGAVDASAVAQLLEAESRAREQAARELAEAEMKRERARQEAADATRLEEEASAHRERAELAGALEQELRGNRFIAYVQREAMAALARDAGARLEQLTSGRYRLVSTGDEFTIVDHHNGDEERSVRTLSGGETFLASLALALALAERLPELAGTGAAVALESLFLDEGFGALDAESLDLAVQGLEALAGGERMIGVVSHVPEIAERLPQRIEVVPGVHGSAIRAD